MVNYAEFYIPLKKLLVKNILPKIKRFDLLIDLDIDEFDNLQYYSFKFHPIIKEKLGLFKKEIDIHLELTKRFEKKVKEFIIDYFEKIQQYPLDNHHYNISNCWINLLRNEYDEHFYAQQFNSIKQRVYENKFEYKNFKDFYDFLKDKFGKDIEKTQKQQKKLISLIKEVSDLLDKYLKVTWIEKLGERNFNLLILGITGILMIFSSIFGGYTVYYLTQDNNPQLFVYSNFITSNYLNVEITNTQNIATSVKIKWKDASFDGWVLYDYVGLFDIQEEKKIFKIEPDLNFIAEKILRNKNDTLYEGDIIDYILNLEIEVTCDNCKENNIIYSKGWYSHPKVSCKCINEYCRYNLERFEGRFECKTIQD